MQANFVQISVCIQFFKITRSELKNAIEIKS